MSAIAGIILTLNREKLVSSTLSPFAPELHHTPFPIYVDHASSDRFTLELVTTIAIHIVLTFPSQHQDPFPPYLYHPAPRFH